MSVLFVQVTPALFNMATEESGAPSSNPKPMTHMEWHPRWHTHAGRWHVCKRRCFPPFFFFSCQLLQHSAALVIIWGENMAWCHLWHGGYVWKMSSRAAQKNGRQTLVRIGLATICPLQWILVLVSRSHCQSWVTVCRLNINTAQIRSFRLGKASRSPWTGLWCHPGWQGGTAPPAPLAPSAQPRASSGPRFLSSPPVSSTDWALCLRRKVLASLCLNCNKSVLLKFM